MSLRIAYFLFCKTYNALYDFSDEKNSKYLKEVVFFG